MPHQSSSSTSATTVSHERERHESVRENETTALLSSSSMASSTSPTSSSLRSSSSPRGETSSNLLFLPLGGFSGRGGAYGATVSLIDDSNNSNRSSSNRRLRNNNGTDLVVETVLSSETDHSNADSPGSTASYSYSISPLSAAGDPLVDSPMSADTNDDDGIDPHTRGGTPVEGAEEEEDSADGADGTRDGAVGTLTRRLRCLFSTITWPIVPLGTIVALALLWVLYAASSLDLRKACSRPLHWYAFASLVLVAYIPHHAQVRSHLFHYSRDRDGPIRPARVRMYDQFFHTVCLLYVYTGVTLIQTCREDLVNPGSTGGGGEDEISLPTSDGPLNSCEATCPNLYQALSVYVATLEVFTFALILPLLFLPCIYLWFLRRATAEAEAFAQLQDRIQEEEALLSNGGVTVGEILDGLENVKLVSPNVLPTSNHTNSNKNNSNNHRTDTDGMAETLSVSSTTNADDEPIIWLIPDSATDVSIGKRSNVRECCICMTDFPIQSEADLEDGLLFHDSHHDNSNSSSSSKDRRHRQHGSTRHDDGNGTSSSSSSDDDENDEIENDGRRKDSNQSNHNDDDDDLGEDGGSGAASPSARDKGETGIVRTRCGHIFHKECLAGWVGGRWQLNPTSSNNSSNNNNDETNNQERRRRRARQTGCPLCREDLRPNTTTN